MESLTAAAQAAAAAAAAAAAEVGEAVAPLALQAQIVFAAALQVFEALTLLLLEACGELVSWSARHPYILGVALATLALWVLAAAARGVINAKWEKGLRDGSFRRPPPSLDKLSPEAARLWGLVAEDPESEDEGAEGREPQPPRSNSAVWHISNSLSPTPGADGTAGGRPRSSSDTPNDRPSRGDSFIATVLGQNRMFAELNDQDCVDFLNEGLKVLTFGPKEAVFKQGDPRDAFLVVKSGQVQVQAASPSPREGERHGEEYTLHPGDTVAGLLFVIASLRAGRDGKEPPEICQLHSSSAHACTQGAEVFALPTARLGEAFDRFPGSMEVLVRRLCTRLALVVFEALSVYFGLRREVITKTTYSLLDVGKASDLSALTPSEVFARMLGWQHGEAAAACYSWFSAPKRAEMQNEKSKAPRLEALAQATLIEREAGEYAMPPNQRASYLLVLLEGNLFMQIAEQNPGTSGDPANSNPQWQRQVSSSEARGLQVHVGEAIGELSILIDRPSPLLYWCATKCRFAALPREAAQRLLQLEPRSWCLRLLHLVTARTAGWLHRVDAALDWVPVEGGRCLYRKGDPMLGFFVVLSGRLVALEEREPGTGDRRLGSKGSHAAQSKWRVTDILQRGRLCGELECLRATPYTQTVWASRDTEVCRVSPTLLHLIAIEFPKAILHFSSLLGQQAAVDVGATARRKVTITVVPADEDVKVNDVCASLANALNRLGKTIHLSPDSDLVGPGPISARALAGGRVNSSRLDGSRLARLLAELEDRCHWLVYEAEPVVDGKVTDWTKRCVRQADHILVVANFNGSSRGDVPMTTSERYVEEAAPLYVERELVLLHSCEAPSPRTPGRFTLRGSDEWSRLAPAAAAADSLRPGLKNFFTHHTQQLFLGLRAGGAKRSTRHYLRTRPWARRWHHVRTCEAGDWARCARLLAGRGIGVCFGGGGARGNCHFGVVRALQELGIPIDVVSGTSFGALAGAIYSMTAPEPSTMTRLVNRVMGKAFSTRKMLMDLNFPRTSYFTGNFLNYMLKDVFARRRCEDLLVPFACTSTDIVHFAAKMHREGPLWRIVRASMSLVGFVPPLPFEERRAEETTVCTSLLVDGGYVNQYPIEVLKEHGAGIVICVVACPDYAPVCTDYGDRVWGGLITLQRMFGCRRRCQGPDPPTQAEIQERLMFLVESMKESHNSRADLTITPAVEGYGLLDFSKHKEISQVGYEAALPRLKEWLAEGSKAAEQVMEVIGTSNSHGTAQSSINGTEYGTRHVYRQWRRNWRKLASGPQKLLQGLSNFSGSCPDLGAGHVDSD